jgi:hypothetical protein
MGNGNSTQNIIIDGDIGKITANTFSGGTASFNYLTGSTASFKYLTGSTASFDYIVPATRNVISFGGGTITSNVNNPMYISNTTNNNFFINSKSVITTINSFATNDIAIGVGALESVTVGSANVAIGTNACNLNTSGNDNIGVGFEALKANTTGSDNTCIGQQSGNAIKTGSSNTCVGSKSASGIVNSSYNTFLGASTTFDNTSNNYTGSSAIGYKSIITSSNQVVLGTSTETVTIPGKLGFVNTGSFNYLSANTLTAGNIYTNTITGSTGSIDYINSSSITCIGNNSYTNLTSNYLNLWNKNYSISQDIGRVSATQNTSGTSLLNVENTKECMIYSTTITNEWLSGIATVTSNGYSVTIAFDPNVTTYTETPFNVVGKYFWALTPTPIPNTWKTPGTFTPATTPTDINIGGIVSILNWGSSSHSYTVIPASFTSSGIQMPPNTTTYKYLSLIVQCYFSDYATSPGGAANADSYKSTSSIPFKSATQQKFTITVNNLPQKTASIDAYTGDINSYIGTIYTNTLTGGTASFNYVTGGTASFNYLSTNTLTTYNTTVNTIKLDGVNGFISYPNTTISSGQSLNLSSILSQTFSNRTPFTVDLIDGFGSLKPGLYSLTNLLSGNYVPVGGLSFSFNATPSATDDNYLSLMIVANNNSSYNSTTWQTNQYGGNGICLSSSNFKIPTSTLGATNYRALFSINGLITITPDYPYLHLILCTQILESNWTFNKYITVSGYLFSPGSSNNNGLSLYLKPLS